MMAMDGNYARSVEMIVYKDGKTSNFVSENRFEWDTLFEGIRIYWMEMNGVRCMQFVRLSEIRAIYFQGDPVEEEAHEESD